MAKYGFAECHSTLLFHILQEKADENIHQNFQNKKTVSFSIRSNAMAGAVRLELTTYGFGDRCSTS